MNKEYKEVLIGSIIVFAAISIIVASFLVITMNCNTKEIRYCEIISIEDYMATIEDREGYLYKYDLLDSKEHNFRAGDKVDITIEIGSYDIIKMEKTKW